MAGRPKKDIDREWAELVAALTANSTARDSFLAIAHTALFAASIAFLSDIVGDQPPIAIWLLVISWAMGVIGLMALTVSYVSADKAIRKRFEQIHDLEAPNANITDRLNLLATVTFAVSLILTFAFSSINVLYMTERRNSPSYEQRGVAPAPRMPSDTGHGGGAGVPPAPRMPSPSPSPAPAPTPKG